MIILCQNRKKITLKHNIIKCRVLNIIIAYENLDFFITQVPDEPSEMAVSPVIYFPTR